jgi:hypothetical protein
MAEDEFETIRSKDSHGPIQAAYQNQMRAVASVIHEYFNPTGEEGVVFTMLLTKSGEMEGGRVNYISNGTRSEMIEMTKEWLARAEASEVVEGNCLESPPRLLPEDK